MMEFGFMLIALFSTVIWNTQSKEVHISRNPFNLSQTVQLALDCNNGSLDDLIYVTGLSYKDDYKEQIKAGCNNEDTCTIEIPVAQGGYLNISYECESGTNGGRHSGSVRVSSSPLHLTCLNNGKIRIGDVLSSTLPSVVRKEANSLRKRITAKCNEKKRCKLMQRNLTVGVTFTTNYVCLKKIPCRITLQKNFSGQTLTSASELVIESMKYSSGAYIKTPSNIQCRLTSSDYRYVDISVVEFHSTDTAARFFMDFATRNESITLHTNQSYPTDNYTIYLHSTVMREENITMTVRKKMRFHLRINAYDYNRQPAKVNITCRQDGSMNVAYRKQCQSDKITTVKSTVLTWTTTVPQIYSSNSTTSDAVHQPETTSTLMTTTREPQSRDMKEPGRNEDNPDVTTQEIKSSESDQENKVTTTPQREFNPQENSTNRGTDIFLTPTVESNGTPMTNSGISMSAEDENQMTTLKQTHVTYAPYVPYKTSRTDPFPEGDTTAVGNNMDQVTEPQKEISTAKKITDVAWKIAVVGIFIILMAVIVAMRCQARKSKTLKMQKSRVSMALSEVSFFGAFPYEMWARDADKQDNEQHTLTTTFRDSRLYERDMQGPGEGPVYADIHDIRVQGDQNTYNNVTLGDSQSDYINFPGQEGSNGIAVVRFSGDKVLYKNANKCPDEKTREVVYANTCNTPEKLGQSAADDSEFPKNIDKNQIAYINVTPVAYTNVLPNPNVTNGSSEMGPKFSCDTTDDHANLPSSNTRKHRYNNEVNYVNVSGSSPDKLSYYKNFSGNLDKCGKTSGTKPTNARPSGEHTDMPPIPKTQNTTPVLYEKNSVEQTDNSNGDYDMVIVENEAYAHM